MSRLASFRGPSVPSSNPVSPPGAIKSSKPNPNQSRGSPRRPSAAQTRSQTPKRDPDSPTPADSPFHRKTRLLLLELRGLTQAWDDLVLLDGLRMLKALVDARTELDNELKVAENIPKRRLVTPKVAIMEKSLAGLSGVVNKLQKTFKKMCAVLDSLESLLTEAHQAKGWKWCVEEPLWVTWPLERFVTALPPLIHAYGRSLCAHGEMLSCIRSHDTNFEQARKVISQWAAQDAIQENGWEGTIWGGGWEELCEIEIEGWSVGR